MIRRLIPLFALALALPLSSRADADETLIQDMNTRVQALKRDALSTSDLKQATEDQAQMAKIMEDTLAKLSPKARAMMTVSLKVVQPLQEQAGTYVKMVDAFSSSDDARFTTITGRDQIGPRRERIAKLAAANAALITLYHGMREHAEQLLATADIASAEKKAYLNEFDESFGRTIGPTMAIRELDRKLYGEWTAALDLLDRQWGKWTVNPQQQIEWAAAEGRDQFNAIMANIQTYSERQRRAQELLANRA
jgi:hypothetical protein